MSSDKGFVKIYRDLQDHWIWKGEPFSRGQAWVDLIMMVNHKDKKIMFNANLITVKRGSVLTSTRKLAERWQWSINKVRRFLDQLEADGMIEQKRNSKYTVIILVEFSRYQEKRNSDGTQTEHSRNTDGKQTENRRKQTRMIKNDKERKERKEELPSELGEWLEDFDDDDEEGKYTI